MYKSTSEISIFVFQRSPLREVHVHAHTHTCMATQVPQDPSVLCRNIYYCRSCCLYLPSTDFELSTHSRFEHTHKHKHKHKHTQTHTHVLTQHIHVHTHTHTYICTHTYLHTHTHTCTHPHMTYVRSIHLRMRNQIKKHSRVGYVLY